MVASTRLKKSSISLRGQGAGSGRSRTATSVALAMASCGDAMVTSDEQKPHGMIGNVCRGLFVVVIP